MIARRTLYSTPGGDTIQIKSTAQYLRNLGVKVDINIEDKNIDYSNYDLIHFFNIIRPDDILPHIKKSQLPYVVSTIFVDYSEYEKIRGGKLGLLTKLLSCDKIEYLKTIARAIKNGDKINSSYYLFNGHRKALKFVASKASLLLPNSDSEYNRFVKAYGINVPYVKIPNAVSTSIFNSEVKADKRYENHVLCVGRIEGLKNQLNLIKALQGTDFFLTLVGKPAPNHIAYYNECVKLINENKNMQLIDHVSHEELASIYKAAKVHVLPSWFETTGLSSLEAAIMDCNVVISPKGDTREYFKDFAFYCEPDDIQSIKIAIKNAFDTPVNESLKKMILNEYVWEKTADETLKAYNLVLNK